MISSCQNSNVSNVMEFDDESTVLQVFGESGVEGCCDPLLKERCIQRRVRCYRRAISMAVPSGCEERAFNDVSPVTLAAPNSVLQQPTLPPTIITKVSHLHVRISSASRQPDLNFRAVEDARKNYQHRITHALHSYTLTTMKTKKRMTILGMRICERKSFSEHTRYGRGSKGH
jgi:hypothetical protein